jgi:imidazolonepropionase-like amidohydrolase
MGREYIGTVEIGKLADPVVLNWSPLNDIGNVATAEWVVRGGRVSVRKELEYR